MKIQTKRTIAMSVASLALIAILIGALYAEAYSREHNVDICVNNHFNFFIGERGNCRAGALQ